MQTTAEARKQILDELASVIAQLSFSAACLGEAVEQLGDASAEKLEDQLFRPVQRAMGRAKRTQAGFAERVGLTIGSGVGVPSAGLASQGAKVFVERAVEAAVAADNGIAALQDSMLPVEAGDPELRAGLGEAREALAPLPVAGREFLRVLGR